VRPEEYMLVDGDWQPNDSKVGHETRIVINSGDSVAGTPGGPIDRVVTGRGRGGAVALAVFADGSYFRHEAARLDDFLDANPHYLGGLDQAARSNLQPLLWASTPHRRTRLIYARCDLAQVLGSGRGSTGGLPLTSP
jgi:hypothetical protein